MPWENFIFDFADDLNEPNANFVDICVGILKISVLSKCQIFVKFMKKQNLAFHWTVVSFLFLGLFMRKYEFGYY